MLHEYQEMKCAGKTLSLIPNLLKENTTRQLKLIIVIASLRTEITQFRIERGKIIVPRNAFHTF